MATEVDVSAQHTLAELAKRTFNKETLDIANVLAKLSPVIKDAQWYEANGLTEHVHTRAAALASGTWRRINEGVVPDAAQTEQITEPICYLEDRSEIDELLLKLNPEPKKYRYEEDLLHLEGLAQQIETAFFNSDRSTDPDTPNGLAYRYTATSLSNVFGAGGTGDDTHSAWMVKWGKNALHLVYPRNSKTLGIQRNDKGLERVTTSTTTQAALYKWVTQFVFNMGIVVRDDRAVQRLANIEPSGQSYIVNENYLIEMYNNILVAFGDMSGVVLYVSSAVKTQLDIVAKDKPNLIHTMTDPFGKPVTAFWDIPIRVSGNLTAETTIS